jgi:hypothetical protein
MANETALTSDAAAAGPGADPRRWWALAVISWGR